MPNARMPVFQKFIDELREIWKREPDMQKRMEAARPHLAKLVNSPEIHDRSKQWPSTEGRKNLRFYVDPDYGFVVNGVVRVPGRLGSVHDHGDTWVLYGVCDGTESLERWQRTDDGSRKNYAKVEMSSVTTGTQGKVDLVPPFDIHAEQGGPTRSAAVILRSQKTGEGTVIQRLYDPKTGEVVERWGPTQIDYELDDRPV